MDDLRVAEREIAERTSLEGPAAPPRRRWRAVLAVVVLVALAAVVAERTWHGGEGPHAPPPPPPAQVTVSTPLQQTVLTSFRFLGQFSAVDSVELRAQVGGTLTAIGFKDGQIVHAGDLLFTIDPRPFQIKLDQATSALQSAQAKEVLTAAELWRAQQLKRTDFGSAENVDSRAADEHAAQAGIDTAKSAIADTRLDLEYARVTAPFTGRIGAKLVSVGSLVSGSRGGASPTTLLATVVSLDPIYMDFDMSEADYAAYQTVHHGAAPHDDVAISLAGDGHFDRHGTLDFIDNAVNRGSGTIHARATVPNHDLALTPGQFARLRVALGDPAPVLLLPAAAIIPDQSRQIVMTVAPDGTVAPKSVEIGDLYQGLRVIKSGLTPTDRVVIDGMVRVRPGAKVAPADGTITLNPAAE